MTDFFSMAEKRKLRARVSDESLNLINKYFQTSQRNFWPWEGNVKEQVLKVLMPCPTPSPRAIFPGQFGRRSFLINYQFSIKEQSDLSIPGNADYTPLLETESFKTLDLCMKHYCNAYACTFQDISTFTVLNGLFLSACISLLLRDPTYKTCRERVKTNSDYNLFTTEDIVDLLNIYLVVVLCHWEVIGEYFGLCSGF